jgi:hypothetical protein
MGQAHVALEEGVGLLLVQSSPLELVPFSVISKGVASATSTPTAMAMGTPHRFVHLVE